MSKTLDQMNVQERWTFIDHMIVTLQNPSDDLTEWEENFYSSIKIQFQKKGDLSNKQIDILERIYAEKTT